MTEGGQQSWSRLMHWRSECHRRFGSVLDLPVASVHDALAGLLGPNLRVLDIGAGAHKPFRSTVKSAHAEYFSMDIDPEGTFDFGSFEDVPPVAKFDLIIANQVLEHLTIDDAFALLNSAGSHMDQGAGLVATVPNTAHPVRQWDCTHITAWPANDLYSLLRSAGLEVTSLARYTKFPLTANPVKRWIIRTVCKEFRIDWCDSIMAVATKS